MNKQKYYMYIQVSYIHTMEKSLAKKMHATTEVIYDIVLREKLVIHDLITSSST